MARTSMKDLSEMAQNISDVTGENYWVEWAYSAPRLVKQYGNTSGTTEISPRLPSGQLLDWMRAYLYGISVGIGLKGSKTNDG